MHGSSSVVGSPPCALRHSDSNAFRSIASRIDPIVSCPAPPPAPTVVMRARCRSTSRQQGEWCHLGQGVLGGIPLPQAGPAAGSRIAARETRTPQCESLPRSVYFVWRSVDVSTAVKRCALSWNSAYSTFSTIHTPVLVQSQRRRTGVQSRGPRPISRVIRRSSRTGRQWTHLCHWRAPHPRLPWMQAPDRGIQEGRNAEDETTSQQLRGRGRPAH